MLISKEHWKNGKSNVAEYFMSYQVIIAGLGLQFVFSNFLFLGVKAASKSVPKCLMVYWLS